MQILPYTADLEDAVRAFNQRLSGKGITSWRFPESHRPQFPKVDDRVPYQEFFLAVDAGAVRGAYFLLNNRFVLHGEEVTIAGGPHYNVSEGLIDRAYAMVGVMLTQDAVRRQPLMYALGLGGFDMPLTKLLMGMHWATFPVPFYFRVFSSSRFLENLVHLRRGPGKRMATQVLRYTGIGFIALRAAQKRWRRITNLGVERVVDRFGTWADEIWEKCRLRYSLVGMRNSATLNLFYPTEDLRFIRLRVSTDREDIGWAVVLDSQMKAHRHFGDMRLGSIIDCLAAPEDAVYVLNCATRFLRERGVDMIVTNQANAEWCSALAANGYLKGPSNFVLALSPQLADHLKPFEQHLAHIHMNRVDGGPHAFVPLFASTS